MRSVPRAIESSLRSPAPRPVLVEREVELEHVHAASRRGSRAARSVGVVVDEPVHLGERRSRARRRRACACSRALATEMCGSSPDPDAVTASTGTFASGGEPVEPRGTSLHPLASPPSGSPGWSDRGSSRLAQASGRSRPSVSPSHRPRPTAADWKYSASGSPFVFGERLADQLRADDLAVDARRSSRSALSVERDLRDAGDRRAGTRCPRSTVKTTIDDDRRGRSWRRITSPPVR